MASTTLQWLAWLAAFWVAVLGFVSRRRPPARTARFVLGIVAGAVLAHLGWAALHATTVSAHPRILLDPTAGYTVLFLPLGLLLAAPWRAGEPALRDYLAAACAPLPLALAVARLGCLAAGCCHGVPSAVAWAVPHGPDRVHPTPLYEIAGLAALALALRRLPPGWVPVSVLAGFGTIRLAVEPFRVAPPLGPPIVAPSVVAAGWIAVGALLAPGVARGRSDRRRAGASARAAGAAPVRVRAHPTLDGNARLVYEERAMEDPTRQPSAEPGAFSASGPWRVDRAELRWLPGLAAVRAASRAEVVPLARPRSIPPIWRFVQAAALVGSALAGWSFRERRRGRSESATGLSRRLRLSFERLGPAYIKLAQIISSGRGLFPPELVDEFKRCRDQVPPEPFAAVRRVLEEELGRPLGEVFSDIETQPIAAASIAQVHAATLTTGEAVVVKVQRPRVRELVRLDIRAMAWIAPRLVGRIPVAALANPPALVELFAETIVEELDFRLEAENMLDIARVLQEANQSTIVVPRPHPELVTRRMLVMERLSGFPYEQVDAMRRAGIDTESVVRSLYVSFLEGAVIYGVFHGDLHGGNLVVTPEGHVALFDHGITGRLEGAQRLAFLRLMMTGAMNDVRGQLEAFRDLGALDLDADLEAIARLLRVDEPVRDRASLSGTELVAELQRVVKGLLAQGARLPKPLMLFVKGMLFFDGAMTAMAPNVDLFQELARIYEYFVTHHQERIRQDTGVDPGQISPDPRALRASLGLEEGVERITPAEVLRRRDTIRERLEKELGSG